MTNGATTAAMRRFMNCGSSVMNANDPGFNERSVKRLTGLAARPAQK
jgi:hypothetical protein